MGDQWRTNSRKNEETEPKQKQHPVVDENALVIANTLFQQHKRGLYTWTSPDGQHRNQIDYILCSQRWRSSIQSGKTRLGADCGSDHEHLIAKFRLNLKIVGKTTRLFRCDLNQVEVTNRFKGLDLIECLKNYGQRFVALCRRQWTRRPSPRKRNAKRQKALWIAEKRSEKERRKGKIYPFECRVQRITRRNKEALLCDQFKEIEENNRMGKTRDLFKKIRDTKGTFHAKMGE